MTAIPFITGEVAQHGSALLRARVTDELGAPITPAAIDEASYTIWRIDESDPSGLIVVEGHVDLTLAPGDVLFAALQPWDVDAIGYNFAHTLDVSEHDAFPTSGVAYLIVFRLVPTAGQVILVRFKPFAT